MAKQRPTDSGLPRRAPGRALDGLKGEVIDHQHPNLDPSKPHRHFVPEDSPVHDHDDDTGEIRMVDAQFVAASTVVLPATSSAPSVPGGQATADPTPPDVPGGSGDTPESSEHGAGSGNDGGSGRPPSELETMSQVRPDVDESVLGAALGYINPGAEPGFHIRLAEEQARILLIGQHFAAMLKAIAPPAPQLVAEEDARGMWRLLRKIAATHGWDLDNDEGAGS